MHVDVPLRELPMNSSEDHDHRDFFSAVEGKFAFHFNDFVHSFFVFFA